MGRSTPPTVILAFGIVAVVFFGVSVYYLSDKTPILKLKPELEKKYGARGFKTKFIRGDDPFIALEVPAAVGSDAITRRQVGAFALQAYIDIVEKDSKKTSVTRIEVTTSPPTTGPRPSEVVTLDQLSQVSALESYSIPVIDELKRATGRTITLTAAPGITGVVALVDVSAGPGDDADVTRLVLKRLEARGGASLIVVTVASRRGPLVRGAGPDLPALAPHLLKPGASR